MLSSSPDAASISLAVWFNSFAIESIFAFSIAFSVDSSFVSSVAGAPHPINQVDNKPANTMVFFI